MEQQRNIRVLSALPVHEPGPEHPRGEVLVIGRGGLPRLLTLHDLASMAGPDEVTEDFVCREGWRVPRLRWGGVPLARVLEQACAPDAAHVEVASGEFATQVSAADARHALLATHLNGAPIPREHGGPLRLVVPGADCYTSVKWVSRIEVLDAPREDRARAIALARLESRAGR